MFSAACGLDGFVGVLRIAGIALLFHPAVEFGTEACLDIGKLRVVREIFQFVRVFGRVVKLPVADRPDGVGGAFMNLSFNELEVRPTTWLTVCKVSLANAVQVLAAAKKYLACGYGR